MSICSKYAIFAHSCIYCVQLEHKTSPLISEFCYAMRRENWPAVMAQDQLWYYRQSTAAPWQLGPGVTIKVTLSGNKRKPRTLKVTTTDNGDSRAEPYRGPRLP